MAAPKLRVFYSSVSGNLEMNKRQQRIFSVLESLKIPFLKVDISQNSEDKDLMRNLADNPTALPPQIFNGDHHCGDYEKFDNAVEMEQLEAFLKL